MKLTIIGQWGGYPKVNEASSGYLLEHNGFHLLIDCGSGVLSKIQNFIHVDEINAVILSHYHSDHIADIGVLQHARLISGLLGGNKDILPFYAHTKNKDEFLKLTYKNITKGIGYDPTYPLSIGPFQIKFLLTNHPVICYAMRLEADGKTLVYTADTSFKEELVSFSKEVDILLCECNFYGNQDGTNAGHMTSLDAGDLADRAKVKHLILTHLPHYGTLVDLKEEASQKYKGRISIAEYGLVEKL